MCTFLSARRTLGAFRSLRVITAKKARERECQRLTRVIVLGMLQLGRALVTENLYNAALVLHNNMMGKNLWCSSNKVASTRLSALFTFKLYEKS